ncbi:MAG TPA: hypothetical protein VIK96_01180 [Bacilli bacterium]
MNKIESYDLKDVIAFANNETVIESFAGFEIVEPEGKGFFTITNRRLIYHATFKGKLSSSIAVRECALEDVGVISSEYGKRANKLQSTIGLVLLIFGLAGLIYGLVSYFVETLKYGLYSSIAGGILFLSGLIVTLTSKRKMFFLEIYTKSPQANFVSLTSDYFQSPSRGRIKIKPTRETHQLIRELGKHILEAKRKI